MTSEEMIKLLSHYRTCILNDAEFFEVLTHALDLLEADGEERLIKLPCKPGTTVYRIVDMKNHSAFNDFIAESKTMEFGVPYETIMGTIAMIKMDDFGKTAFLTREEAEEKLKGEKK